MSYQISTKIFCESKMFDSNRKFYHKSGYRFKLFPFVTQPNSDPVLELEPLIGNFLCMIEEKTVKEITAQKLSELLRKEIEIGIGQEAFFENMIRWLFFNADGKVRPLNLEMMEQVISSKTSENRIAEYLVDVLGDRQVLRVELKMAKRKALDTSNVLEKLVLSKLEYDERKASNQNLSYFRITNSLKESFEEDFKYVLENSKRSRDLVSLLELYFFTYTAQTSLQLKRFLAGKRDENIPLYFCLEWEKTSQSRSCFTEGWQKLQAAIEEIFVHAIVLEILNQTEKDCELVDYIRIAEMIQNDADDSKIASQIDEITDCYRKAISDCPTMNELQRKVTSEGTTADAIHYLFESVKTQFEETTRDRANKSYVSKFERYCHKFLKNRGRSGLMLNLTEETLIFITKLCIKNQKQMRLKDVFNAFEKRGIFLDSFSKEQVASYYEKLNLIEKKSDSGDAKYVKRIL